MRQTRRPTHPGAGVNVIRTDSRSWHLRCGCSRKLLLAESTAASGGSVALMVETLQAARRFTLSRVTGEPPRSTQAFRCCGR